MSVDYAAGLSHCDDLGDCGANELFDTIDEVKKKVDQLADWLREYRNSCIIHIGAGLSTSAGIRDFRGKNGVWTELLNKKDKVTEQNSSHIDQSIENNPTKKMKLEPVIDDPNHITFSEDKSKIELKPFDQTEPTVSHMALLELCHTNYVKHIVSQNVDGLFLKSGLERKYISELHGNFYLDECTCCKARFIRCSASKTMKLEKSTIKCPKIVKPDTRQCKGYLRDTILDWESPIPYQELRLATKFSKECKLHICIGTSLQLSPSKDLVCDPTRNKTKKLVIINLQPTRFNVKANLVINYYADFVMTELMKALGLQIPTYNISTDPTKKPTLNGTQWKR